MEICPAGLLAEDMKFPRVSFRSSAGEARAGRDSRQLSRDFASGRAVRIRRGVYVPTEAWLAGTAADRYALTTASLAVQGPAPVLCRETALMAWGLEFRSVPSHVRYRTPRRSAVGSVPPADLYGDPSSAAAAYARLRPGARRLPQGFPDARHFATSPGTQKLLVPHLGLSLPVEPLDVALTDTLHRLPFVDAVILSDALLAGRGELAVDRSREALVRLADGLRSAAARRRLNAIVNFADGQSESVGESYSRALMHELGFEPPQLQVWIHADGRRIARVDFYWPRLRLVGEFDGLTKYLGARDAAQTVVAEKRREDAIRATGERVVRWGWEDLVRPERFAAILHRAGVPRMS